MYNNYFYYVWFKALSFSSSKDSLSIRVFTETPYLCSGCATGHIPYKLIQKKWNKLQVYNTIRHCKVNHRAKETTKYQTIHIHTPIAISFNIQFISLKTDRLPAGLMRN